MLQVGALALLAGGIFVALVLLKVDSWGWRILLLAVVAGLYHWFGVLVAMIAAALLSVAILIADQIPVTSRI